MVANFAREFRWLVAAMLLLGACSSDEDTDTSDAAVRGDVALPPADDVLDEGRDDATPGDTDTPSVCGALTACTEGVCVDTQGDPAHCGACGTTCADGQSCVAGGCVDIAFPCADRVLGSVGSGVTVVGTTLGMGDDVSGLCLRSGTNEDTTLYWRVPQDGRWDLNFSSRDFDVVAQASLLTIPGFCNGNELDCDDDGNGPNGARLSLDALAGQEILITVDAFRNTGQGAFELSFTRTGDGPARGDGACQNVADINAFNRGLDVFAALACHDSECSAVPEAEREACISSCVQVIQRGTEPLSEPCADCFGTWFECMVEACGLECLTPALPCETCDFNQPCGVAFGTCTGF